MVRDPAVFLFDEPLSNLDAQLRTQMRLEIKKLHHRVGNTIIFVTHDQVEAMTMADRIVIMKDGHIQQVGTPDEVYHKPANTFVARFIGAPSMNMLNGISDGSSVTLNAGQNVPLSARNGDVVLGVRPDDLTLEGGTPLISGEVTVREPLGPETLIYVATPEGEVIAKADGRTPPEIGATVSLSADPANLHLFDAASGAALA
jgi:multiple sugar transport system ATP-binding protein